MKKNRILFFCPLPPPVGGQALISEIIYKQIRPTYIINTNVKNKYFDNINIVINCIYKLLFLRIELVYFTCTRSKKGAVKDIILLLLCRIRKIKVINHLHGNEVMDLFNSGVFSVIIHWLYNNIDTTIFVTERQKQLMPMTLKKMKRVTIPNCYDPSMDNIERTFSNDKKVINILFISFIMKSKGVFIALEVFELIAKKYNNVIFHIAGEPRSDDLMSLSEIKDLFYLKLQELKNKYPDRIIYHGVVKDDQKTALFLNNDILLFPTFFKTESFGLVNVEAMRAGNVIITTNHNFLADIVSKEEGILVQPNNIEETVNAVQYFIENPKIMREMQIHNIEHAKKHYSPNKFKKNIEKNFNKFIS